MTTGRMGDCEAIVDGWLGQPSNALSSLAYVLVALVVVAAVRRGTDRWPGYGLAASLGLVGLGSFLFHRVGDRLGDYLHTASIGLLLLALLAVGVTHRVRFVRRVLPPALLFTVGLAVYSLSRTGGPLCDPDSLLQGHAAWHVLSAVAAGWFGVRVLTPANAKTL